jgi:uncharacterized protein YfbU (UPF0304 family)
MNALFILNILVRYISRYTSMKKDQHTIRIQQHLQHKLSIFQGMLESTTERYAAFIRQTSKAWKRVTIITP